MLCVCVFVRVCVALTGDVPATRSRWQPRGLMETIDGMMDKHRRNQSSGTLFSGKRVHVPALVLARNSWAAV